MEKSLKILMLEDLEEDAGLIERTLEKEKVTFTRMRVETRDDFTTALDAFSPDIILSDHSLPQFNSIEALDICKKHKAHIPFILVTGAVSEEFAVNCLRRGADDYILKSNLSRLPMAIQYAVRQHQSQNDRTKQEEMLRTQNENLVKINRELDSFVYSISHNLRSPLSSVLGLVNVAKMDPKKSLEKTDHYFELIEKSVLKLDWSIHKTLEQSSIFLRWTWQPS
jgi:DNA-binding response OmpR family regulator